ncbi:MAG: hypothetical protein RL277_134 [Planctomycetota bacterium]|jgi:hypothetical protein
MFCASLLSLLLLVQAPPPADNTVIVPQWSNSTCPVMGKPISLRLFTDTKYGRIYICCKVCVKDIHDDLDVAYGSAYPAPAVIDNKLCPVTGRELPKDAPKVSLQGREFRVFDKAAAQKASEDAQVTLARLLEPNWQLIDNKTCPVSGEAVAANTILVYKSKIVRLSTPKAVDEFRKDPDKLLAKAEAIRAKELEEERRKQGEKTPPAPAPKDKQLREGAAS